MPELSLFDQYKIILDGKYEELENVSSGSLYPLLRWFSFDKRNLPSCQVVNKSFMFVGGDILKAMLYFGIDRNARFIKYLKKGAKDDTVLQPYLKKHFHYSESEYDKNKDVLSYVFSFEKNKEIAVAYFGMSDSEIKKLGLTPKKIKFEKKQTEPSGSLTSFFGGV